MASNYTRKPATRFQRAKAAVNNAVAGTKRRAKRAVGNAATAVNRRLKPRTNIMRAKAFAKRKGNYLKGVGRRVGNKVRKTSAQIAAAKKNLSVAWKKRRQGRTAGGRKSQARGM